MLISTFKSAHSIPQKKKPSSYPFGIFDKVASTGTLGNSLRKDAALDSLLRLLDDVCKLGVVGEMIEVSTVVA